jgi:laminin alpha 3/5
MENNIDDTVRWSAVLFNFEYLLFSGFCNDAVFSLTADYNNGALPCNCDFAGSLSFECEKFGGQCPCKPNVIGRHCEACRTGFYGFPDCKPCDCPSVFCEAYTGKIQAETHKV